MSYEIVYSKQFLKTEDGKIIPLTLCGSNNCYSVEIDLRGRRYEKRERNWNALYTNGRNINIAITPEKLLEKVMRYTREGSYQQHFMMYSKWVNDESLIRFINNGIKNAKTIEELDDESNSKIYLKAGFSIWYKTNEEYSNGTPITKNKYENYKDITSSQELTEFLNFADKRIETKSDNEEVYVSLSFPGEKAVPYPKEKKLRQKREKPEEYWSIMREDGLYLIRLTKGGAKLSHYKSGGKCFITEKAANKYITDNYLNSRFNSIYKYKAEFISEKSCC